MALRPSVDDLVAWLNLDGDPSTSDEEAFLAAREMVERRCTLPDDALEVDSDTYPQEVRTGVLLAAAKLVKRSSSPSGVEGFDGFAVRIVARDPDVEALIAPYLSLTGFY